MEREKNNESWGRRLFNTWPCFRGTIFFIYLPSKQLSVITRCHVCTITLSDLIGWVNARRGRGWWKSSNWTSYFSSVQRGCFASGCSSCNRRQTQHSFKTPPSGRVLSCACYTKLFNPQLGSWLIAAWPFTSIRINSLEAVLALLNTSHFCSRRPRIYTTLLIAISLGTVIFFLSFSF